MKKIFFFAILLLWTAACQNPSDNNTNTSSGLTSLGLSMVEDTNPEWQHPDLQLYPVVADAATLEAGEAFAQLKTLAEGMKNPAFRIMEKKQFGRGENWQHALTVQNKSQDAIFMMAGDVVTGGNQDRVIAYHHVIPPASVKNIEVFCVEQGRSSYYDPNAPAAEKQTAAFKGFYNVASPKVRRAVQNSRNQSEVWAAVAKVTESNGATSSTNTYAALDQPSEQKEKRDACIRFFTDKLTDRPDVLGMVAVSHGKVVGIDIFAHPAIFRQHYTPLLHSYVTEAMVDKSTLDPFVSQAQTIKARFESVARLASQNNIESQENGRFSMNGQWLHLFAK
jgi:hypothetical protein